MIDIFADVGLAATTIGLLVFLIGYGCFVRWRSSRIGRHMMGFMSALGMLASYAVLRRLGVLDGYECIGRMFCWVLAAIIVWWRVILFFSVWRKGE